MLSATVLELEYEEIVPAPAIDQKIEGRKTCTVCLGESGVAFPLTHECESDVNADQTTGFVTFSSFDLNGIYKGLRP